MAPRLNPLSYPISLAQTYLAAPSVRGWTPAQLRIWVDGLRGVPGGACVSCIVTNEGPGGV